MTLIHGQIQIKTSQRRTQKRLTSHEIRLGEVPLANNKVAYTKLGLYVPSPTDLGHLPGVFLTLSNSSGRCFCRLNPTDLPLLLTFMSDISPALSHSLSIANDISFQLAQLDKTIHQQHPLINYSITDVTGVKEAAEEPLPEAEVLDP